MIFSAVLLRATTGLTHGQYQLCGHGAAIAIAVEPGGVAAGPAITFAGDEIDERRHPRPRRQPRPGVGFKDNLSPSLARALGTHRGLL